jgi:hypothetical protein
MGEGSLSARRVDLLPLQSESDGGQLIDLLNQPYITMKRASVHSIEQVRSINAHT